MRAPNGYGSIIKLSGNRRKPYACRKTVGYYDNGNPKYKFLSYHATRREAMLALAKYNEDPHSVKKRLKLSELYDMFCRDYFGTVSESQERKIRASWRVLSPLYGLEVKDIRLTHLQGCIDESGRNTPMLKAVKNLLSMLWGYAIKYEYIAPDRMHVVKDLNVEKSGNPNKIDREPFSRDQIAVLWDHAEDPAAQLVLVLIYSGLRIGELFDLKKEDVHLSDQYFSVIKSKTEAGVRDVPIADRIYPIWAEWMQKPGAYAFQNQQGRKLSDSNFRAYIWQPLMQELNMNHRPHDTRHTCISLLTMAGVPDIITKKIVGHAGSNVTETVYTHIDLPAKLQAINKI